MAMTAVVTGASGFVASEITKQLLEQVMNGVKFKRVAGDVWDYRNMCQTLMTQMKL